MQIGDRITHTSGARGEIVAAFNGGACYQIRTDSGAKFTVERAEIALEGSRPKARHIECGIGCRTVVAFETAYQTPRPRGRPAFLNRARADRVGEYQDEEAA